MSLKLGQMLSATLGPSPLAILFTIVLVITLPLLLHIWLYRSSSSTTLPTFLLIGPSGSGKTSLLTLFERGRSVETRTSQTPLTVEVSLPVGTKAASTRYRSAHDSSSQVHKLFWLADTPGHGKLRHHAIDNVVKSGNLKGIIFMVDATDLSSSSSTDGTDSLRLTAEYLHDILLLLQTRTSKTASKAGKGLPLLLAANKLDLFTALPAALVKSALEKEITKVRDSRSKGLLDSGVGMTDASFGEEKDILGEGMDEPFKFSQMTDNSVEITVEGGNVLGADGPAVEKWWGWIADQL